MKTLVVVALDGMMDASLAIALDTLRASARLQARGAAAAGRVLVAGHRRTVRTAGGARLDTDLRLGEVLSRRPPAWIVLPGLGLAAPAAIAPRLARPDARAAMALVGAAPAATRIAAACSSVYLLAATGLLDGRDATMTWWLAPDFRARHPAVRLDEARMLARDGRFLTAGAAFATLDLSLAVVADAMGAAVAARAARFLVIDERPSQARFMIPSLAIHADPTVAAAERWVDGRLAGPLADTLSVAALADALALTPRTLARRLGAAAGLSPIRFIQRRRLLAAGHLLDTTTLSVEAVAGRVGYADSTALRKLVKREFGLTPRAMRG